MAWLDDDDDAGAPAKAVGDVVGSTFANGDNATAGLLISDVSAINFSSGRAGKKLTPDVNTAHTASTSSTSPEVTLTPRGEAPAQRSPRQQRIREEEELRSHRLKRGASSNTMMNETLHGSSAAAAGTLTSPPGLQGRRGAPSPSSNGVLSLPLAQGPASGTTDADVSAAADQLGAAAQDLAAATTGATALLQILRPKGAAASISAPAAFSPGATMGPAAAASLEGLLKPRLYQCVHGLIAMVNNPQATHAAGGKAPGATALATLGAIAWRCPVKGTKASPQVTPRLEGPNGGSAVSIDHFAEPMLQCVVVRGGQVPTFYEPALMAARDIAAGASPAAVVLALLSVIASSQVSSASSGAVRCRSLWAAALCVALDDSRPSLFAGKDVVRRLLMALAQLLDDKYKNEATVVVPAASSSPSKQGTIIAPTLHAPPSAQTVGAALGRYLARSAEGSLGAAGGGLGAGDLSSVASGGFSPATQQTAYLPPQTVQHIKNAVKQALTGVSAHIAAKADVLVQLCAMQAS